MIYYVEMKNGYCGLTDNKQQVIREEGTNNVKSITPATKEQIAWVQAMGGYVPTQGGK